MLIGSATVIADCLAAALEDDDDATLRAAAFEAVVALKLLVAATIATRGELSEPV